MQRRISNIEVKSCALVLIALLCADQLCAEVILPSAISNHMVLQRQMPIPIWGWARVGEKVTVALGDSTQSTTTGADSRWKVEFPAREAGGPIDLTIQGASDTLKLTDILIGDVWVCGGQSNMEHPLSTTLEAAQDIPQAENPKLRLSVVPRTFSGKPRDDINRIGWFRCTPKTVPNFSAVAYYFGREIQKRTGVPIGLVQCSWYGTSIQVWTSLRAFEANPIIKQDYDTFVTALPKEYIDWHDRAEEFHEAANAQVGKTQGKVYFLDPPPTGCYNAMVHPLTRFPIEGVIWYQGESDAPRHDRYAQALSIMAKDWRDAWAQGEFPFLYVQIGYCKWWSPTWAAQCEAQQKAESLIPNSAMVVMADLHDNWGQHPRMKRGVGERLALAARANVYGEKNVAWRAPRFKSASVEGSSMRLSFEHTGGRLEARGEGALSGFMIAGADGKFQPAEATIDVDTIVVSAKGVEKPVTARFNWEVQNPITAIYSAYELPLTPFRTNPN